MARPDGLVIFYLFFAFGADLIFVFLDEVFKAGRLGLAQGNVMFAILKTSLTDPMLSL